MKASKRAEIVLAQFKLKYLFEIVFIVGAGIFGWLSYLGFIPHISEKYDFAIPILLFGLICILASNLLSFWWSLTWIIFPIFGKYSPKSVKILGGIMITIALFSLYIV